MSRARWSAGSSSWTNARTSCSMDGIRRSVSPQQRLTQRKPNPLEVVGEDPRDERLFRREVLIQRGDVDASDLGDAVGAGPVVPFPNEHSRGRFEEHLDGRACPLLRRLAPGPGISASGHTAKVSEY